MGLFNRTITTDLLARDIKIVENPNAGDYYLYVEGDETGIINWILKKMGLKDPSVSLSVSDKYVTRINGKKYFSVKPTSEVHNFDSGFAKNKKHLIYAGIFFMMALTAINGSIGSKEIGGGSTLIIFLILMGALQIWLYGRSGALIVDLNTFNGQANERIRVKSGLTGMKLEKEHFEQLFGALKNAISNNSKYFRKQ